MTESAEWSLAAIAAGDTAAFGSFYDEFAPLVYGIARRVVRDPVRSEDVTQDVFAEVWRKAAEFDPERGRVRSWVATIAHRRAVDVVRTEEAHRRREDAGSGDRAAVAAATGLDQQVVSSDESRAVRSAMATLPVDQRQALELAYFDGLTHVQVADAQAVPLGTVKSRIRLGLERLRLAMEGAT